MPIDFIKDISSDALKEEIKWYLQNAACTINHTFIATEAVRLKTANRTMNDMYERCAVEQWLRNHRWSDPISRQKVTEIESFRSAPIEELSDTSNNLKRLTKFIRVHLHALQHYITTDSLTQVRYWLQIWKSAVGSLNNSDGSSVQQNAGIELLSITLPEGRTLVHSAYIYAATKLEKYFKSNYGLEHTPTPYDKFCRFLNIVNTMEPATPQEYWSVYSRYFPEQTKPEFAHHILKRALLTANSSDVVACNKSEIDCTPMQIACYQGNDAAVSALIYGGATMQNALQYTDPLDRHNTESFRTADARPWNATIDRHWESLASEDEDESFDWDTPLRSKPNQNTRSEPGNFLADIQSGKIPIQKLSLPIIAAANDDMKLFVSLKDTILPGDMLTLQNCAQKIIALDKPDFLNALAVEYGFEINVYDCIEAALNQRAINTLGWLLESFEEFITAAQLQADGLNWFTQLPCTYLSRPLTNKECAIILKLLTHFPMVMDYDAFKYDLRIHPQLLLSRNIYTMLGRLPCFIGILIEHNHKGLQLYRSLFAHSELFRAIQSSGRIRKLEQGLETCIKSDDIKKKSIKKLLLALATPSVPESRPLLPSFESHSERKRVPVTDGAQQGLRHKKLRNAVGA